MGLRFFYPTSRFVRVNNLFLLLPMIMIAFFINFFFFDTFEILNEGRGKLIEFSTTKGGKKTIACIYLYSIAFGPILRLLHFSLESTHDYLRFWFSEKCKFVEWATNFVEKYFFSTLYLALSHPWVAHTRHNKKAEILMVDALTRDGNLYSGIYSNFIPTVDKERVLSISIENAIRYYPKDNSNPKDNERLSCNETTEEEKTAIKRRVRNIKNSGELIIPFNQIETVHLWKQKIGISPIVNFYNNSNSYELLKWYLLIMKKHPHAYQELIICILKEKEKTILKQKISSLKKEYEITNEMGKKIKIKLYKFKKSS